MDEIWVRSLGWEDPMEKEMANPSNILAWRIPWTEEPGRLQSMRSQKDGHDLATESPPPRLCMPHPIPRRRKLRLALFCNKKCHDFYYIFS